MPRLMGEGKYSCLSKVSLDTVLPHHRRSFHRSSLSSLSSKSLWYDKLDQLPINLTVLKLDGTSFEIIVTKTATIADLKQAVENVFSHLPAKGPAKVSWTYVWGHFCLSHGGTKLLNDGDDIKDYGINDGDKLNFVRHLSFTYNLNKKKQSRKEINNFQPASIPEEEEEQRAEEQQDDVENLKCQQFKFEKDNNDATNHDSLVYRLFRGWFLYSRIENSNNKLKFGTNMNSTRWGGRLVVSLKRNLFHICDSRPSSRFSSRVSQVEI